MNKGDNITLKGFGHDNNGEAVARLKEIKELPNGTKLLTLGKIHMKKPNLPHVQRKAQPTWELKLAVVRKFLNAQITFKQGSKALGMTPTAFAFVVTEVCRKLVDQYRSAK